MTWTFTTPTGSTVEFDETAAETVEYDRTSVEFVVERDKTNRSVVETMRSVAGETRKEFVAPGSWQAFGDVADNQFTVSPPSDRSASYDGTVYIDDFKQSREDARGNYYRLSIEYLHESPPATDTVTESADTDQWAFDFNFAGRIATGRLDVETIDERDSGAGSLSVDLLLTPDQAAQIHTVPTYLERPDDDEASPPVERVERESADDFFVDNTPEDRNSVVVAQPSAGDNARTERIFPPGEYVVTGWSSEWVGQIYRVTLELGVRRVIEVQSPGFEVSVTGTNSPVAAGDSVTVDWQVENTGASEDTQDIVFTVDGVEEGRKSNVTVAAGATDSGQFSWDTTGESGGRVATATVRSDDTSASVTVGTTQPDPLFVVEDLSIADVVAGEVVTATATVTNYGSSQDTQPVTFAVLAGGAEAHSVTKQVTLAGGASDTVLLPWGTDSGDAGSYIGEVSTNASTLTAPFEVVEATVDFDMEILDAGQQNQSTDPCVSSGDLVNVDVQVTNTGTIAGTQDITLSVPGVGSVDVASNVFLDPGEQTEQTLQWDTSGSGKTGPTTVEACSQDSCAQDSVTVLDSDTACFDVSITGTDAGDCTFVGATVEVTADIVNNGTGGGEQTVALLVDGVQQDSTTVQLAQGASTTETFAWDTSGYAGDETAEACIQSNNDTDCTDIAVGLDDAALFTVTFTGTNSPVSAGNDITLDIAVENRGGAQATQEITVSEVGTAGEQVYSDNVQLSGCAEGSAPASVTDTVTVSTSAPTPQLPDDQDVQLGDRVFRLESADDSATVAVTVDGTDVRVAITSLTDPIQAGTDQDVAYEAVNRGTTAATQDITLGICDDGQPDVPCQGTLDSPVDTDADVSLPVDVPVTGTLTWADAGPSQADPLAAVVSSADRKTNRPFAFGDDVEFSVSIAGTNSPISEGKTLQVDADVTNTGAVDAGVIASLVIDGESVNSTGQVIGAGATATVTLEWVTESGDTGDYTATVQVGSDSASTSVTVEDSPTTVDNFEDSPDGPYSTGDDLTAYYSGDTGQYTRTTASPTLAGGKSLHAETVSKDFPELVSDSGDGLPNYPSRGDVFEFGIEVVASDAYGIFRFFKDSGDNGYRCFVDVKGDRLQLQQLDSGSLTALATTSVTLSTNTHYRAIIDTSTGDDIDIELRDADANSSVATVSTTDGRHNGSGISYLVRNTGSDPEVVFDEVLIQ